MQEKESPIKKLSSYARRGDFHDFFLYEWKFTFSEITVLREPRIARYRQTNLNLVTAMSIRTSNQSKTLSIFHGLQVWIEISATRDNCVLQVTRLCWVPAKPVIPREGIFLCTENNLKYTFYCIKHYFFFVSLILYLIFNFVYQNC